MRHHLWIASAFVSTACFLSNAAPSHADEREELKAKIAQLREESEELAKNGKPDQARQRKREAAELMAALMACTALGIVLFGLVNLMGATVLRRWTRTTGFESEK